MSTNVHDLVGNFSSPAKKSTVGNGAARAAVLGINDGLVTNLCLVLALAGAGASMTAVQLAGFASLLAGSFSMAAGEWISVLAQVELDGHSGAGSPRVAAISSFAMFAVGAAIPMVPWFLLHGNYAVIGSIAGTTVAAVGVGAFLARASGKSAMRGAVRQLVVVALAAGVTFAIGKIVGTTLL
jgi:VIT1/CCC1 family predicted Fe2+/Mn2+ transporter